MNSRHSLDRPPTQRQVSSAKPSPSCNRAVLSQPGHILERLGSFLNEHRAKGFGDPHPCALPLCLLDLFLDCCDRGNFTRQDRVGRRVQSSKPDTSFTVKRLRQARPVSHHPQRAMLHLRSGLDVLGVLLREDASNKSCCELAEPMPPYGQRHPQDTTEQLSVPR